MTGLHQDQETFQIICRLWELICGDQLLTGIYVQPITSRITSSNIIYLEVNGVCFSESSHAGSGEDVPATAVLIGAISANQMASSSKQMMGKVGGSADVIDQMAVSSLREG